jgi:hypothetical protein
MGYTPFFLKNGRRSLAQLNELISSIENKLYQPESLTEEKLAALKKTFAGS